MGFRRAMSQEITPKNPDRGITNSHYHSSGSSQTQTSGDELNELELIEIVRIINVYIRELQHTFRTPVYTTSNRRNAMGVGLVFEANLATEEHISHWVLQGVCLILNTD